MIGDQVYADEVSPAHARVHQRAARHERAAGRGGRSTSRSTRASTARPGATPVIRWLLSTVSTAMIFDDHDVHDDWNISAGVARGDARAPTGGTSTSSAALDVVLGLPAPRQPRARGATPTTSCSQRVKDADDGWPMLREFARAADRERRRHAAGATAATSAARALVVIDSRAGRVLEEGNRSMVDDEEWEWVERARHRRLRPPAAWPPRCPGCSAPGMHYLEAWSEAVAGGAWGPALAPLGERAAPGRATSSTGPRSRSSFDAAGRAAARGGRGRARPRAGVDRGAVRRRAPRLPGEVAFRRGSGVQRAVYQAVCSPYRNPLEARERRVIRLGDVAAVRAGRRGRWPRAAGVDDPDVRWRMVGDGPWFDNQVATLRIDGRAIELRLEKAVPVDETVRPARASARPAGWPEARNSRRRRLVLDVRMRIRINARCSRPSPRRPR